MTVTPTDSHHTLTKPRLGSRLPPTSIFLQQSNGNPGTQALNSHSKWIFNVGSRKHTAYQTHTRSGFLVAGSLPHKAKFRYMQCQNLPLGKKTMHASQQPHTTRKRSQGWGAGNHILSNFIQQLNGNKACNH